MNTQSGELKTHPSLHAPSAPAAARPVIICDTREQHPLDFGPAVAVERGTLDAGDYSMPGLTERVAIERKELGDLLACITSERERFKRELLRLRSYECKAVAIEANLADVLTGQYRSKVAPASVLGSLASWQLRYGVPFWFCGDRAGAAAVVLALCRNYLAQQREFIENVNALRAHHTTPEATP